MPRKRKKSINRTETATRKCALKKHRNFKSLLLVIKEWVIHVSRISRRGSLIFNDCLIVYYDNGRSPEIDDKELTRLIRACFTITAAYTKFPILNEFWNLKGGLYLHM
eukprot:767730-Hanusia_phi.AAC.3